MKKDYFGQPLEVGDLILGAKPGGRFRNTEFATCVVIGETEQLIRCHQVYDPQDRTKSLESLKERMRVGGKARPEEFILLKKGYLSKQEVEDAAKTLKAKDTTITNALTQLFS